MLYWKDIQILLDSCSLNCDVHNSIVAESVKLCYSWVWAPGPQNQDFSKLFETARGWYLLPSLLSEGLETSMLIASKATELGLWCFMN